MLTLALSTECISTDTTHIAIRNSLNFTMINIIAGDYCDRIYDGKYPVAITDCLAMNSINCDDKDIML